MTPDRAPAPQIDPESQGPLQHRTRAPRKRLALALLLLVPGLTWAGSAGLMARQDRAWAAACATCHASAGPASAVGAPSLNGRDAELTYAQLQAYKNGQLPQATVMPQLAKGYTDDELRRIALYFASHAAEGRVAPR